MLNQNLLKLTSDIQISFSVINNEKFLVFQNKNNTTSMCIRVLDGISIQKEHNFLKFESKTETTKVISYVKYLKNFLNNFKTPSKKTLVLRGLGLKAYLKDSSIFLKLGFSHENIIPVLTNNKSVFIISKNSISILNYNKIFLGNFIEKIYRLKKANCYKSRGLYYKGKLLRLKTIKKT